jgi:YD repeat-containing protein
LIIPGQGSQDILKNQDAATNGTYPAVTNNHWRLSCISESTTANGEPGDGFIAQAPDGTQYYFNELTYGLALGASQTTWNGNTPISSSLGRQVAFLLVTKVVDRFGNSLTYSYNSGGALTGITASDGRALSVQYNSAGNVQSVTLQPSAGAPRTWTYAYTTFTNPLYGGSLTTLQSVTLPDGSQWKYNLGNFVALPYLVDPTTGGSCNSVSVPKDLDAISASIVHPSGLTGTFTVKSMPHGRSFVPQRCANTEGVATADYSGTYAYIPKEWYDFTITQRAVSGAGVPTRTWQYQYSAPNASWDTCTGSCPTTVWTDVIHPDGSTVRRTFSNKFDVTESHLLETDYYVGAAGSSTLMRSVKNVQYADPTPDPNTRPWPASAGGLLYPWLNQAQLTEYSPLQERQIVQDGDTYTWLSEAYDQCARVTRTKRYNSIAGQVPDETQTTYYDGTTLWCQGLPQETDTLNPSDHSVQAVVNKYDYNPSNDTLQTRYHFGQKVMDYTFNSAGQLASFTDANGHTTSLSSYVRGIPTAISYSDGTSESLAVDTFGDITAITDQAGNTTNYSYDAIGRVTGIDYPADTPARNPTTFTYSFITGTERGIVGDHWDRTVSQGNARHVTYFDAELRPLLTDTYISGTSGSDVTAANAYNWRGQTTFASYPVSGSPDVSALTLGTHTSYDTLGREIEVDQDSETAGGSVTSTTAYLSGARKQVTDPNGNVTTTSYQVFDTPTYDSVIEVQAPEGVTQTITRNIYGNPTSITQSGGGELLTKTLVYDAQQRLCRRTEPESGSTVMAYDAAGNLAWSAEGQTITGTDCGQSQVPAGAQVTRTYDALNRVLSINYPDGVGSASFHYDPRGNLASSSVPSDGADWSYTHNATGELTGETLSIDGYQWPFTYAYDANGALASTTYPDGTVVPYAPDALGRPTEAGTYASGATYYPDGHLEYLTYMGGSEYVAEENTRQILRNISYAQGSSQVFSEDLTYDNNANITQITDLVDGTRNASFTYDGLNRLTAATDTHLWGSMGYGYDALNNLTHMTNGGVTATYTYDATNRLASIASGGSTLHSFTYDARGNTTAKDSTSLLFDQADQLDQVVGKDSYGYDASGRRVKTIAADGAKTYAVYSAAGQLMMNYSPNTGDTSDYIHMGKRLIAKVTTNSSAIIGNVDGLTADASGNETLTGWACSTRSKWRSSPAARRAVAARVLPRPRPTRAAGQP